MTNDPTLRPEADPNESNTRTEVMQTYQLAIEILSRLTYNEGICHKEIDTRELNVVFQAIDASEMDNRALEVRSIYDAKETESPTPLYSVLLVEESKITGTKATYALSVADDQSIELRVQSNTDSYYMKCNLSSNEFHLIVGEPAGEVGGEIIVSFSTLDAMFTERRIVSSGRVTITEYDPTYKAFQNYFPEFERILRSIEQNLPHNDTPTI